MDKLTITFLGTGNAIPTKKRNHTAIHVAFANEAVLIDCGEGTQRQFRFTDIKPTKLTRLLITHWHGDHILGLPGLFQTLAMNDYQKTLHIYGPASTKRKLSLLQELHKDIKINFTAQEISNTFIDAPKFSITAHEMNHNSPTLAYSIQIKDQIRIDKNKLKKLKLGQGPHIGLLQKGKDIIYNNKKISSKSLTYTEKGKKIVIILDTAMTEKAIAFSKNADILIAEATFSKEEKEQAAEYKHLTAEQAAQIAKKAKAKQLVLTHISQRYENNPKKIENEAKAVFKNTKIVKDFDAIEI